MGELANTLLIVSIGIIQLLSAAILRAHWDELRRCRDRLHSLEGNQGILHGVLRAKDIIPHGVDFKNATGG